MLSAKQDREGDQAGMSEGEAVTGGTDDARAQACAMDVAAHGAVVVEHLASVYRIVTRELGWCGLAGALVGQHGFALDIDGGAGDVAHHRATLRVRPGLGVEQPVEVLVFVRNGVPDVAAPDLARAVVAQVLAIVGGREAHARARAALRRAADEVVAEAAGEGLDLELLWIEARPLDAEYSRADDVVFDVAMLLLSDERGQVEADAYSMDARDPEEFSAYLRARILPEQRHLQARFAAGRAD
jgi:hypothetical protein